MNTGNLSLSEKINTVSQNYSQYLANLPDHGLKHSGNPKYGENLFFSCIYPAKANFVNLTGLLVIKKF
jgi:hypothetical protein